MRFYKKPLFAISVSLFLVLAVIIITTLVYSNSVHKALQEETDAYMEELTKQNARLICERIKSDLSYLEWLAASISELDVALSSPQTLRILSQWIDITRFKWMAAADKEGRLYVPDYPETPDISQEPYFQSAMNGSSSVMWLPEVDGKSEKLVISVPITDNGQPEGVMLGRYSMENLSELFTVGAFDGKGYNYVIKSNGSIIFRALTDPIASNYKTLNDIAENTSSTLTSDDVKVMLRNMKSGTGGSIIYNRDGQERIMKFIPVGINDWNLALVIPSNVIDAKAQSIIRSTSFYSAVIILSFSVVASLLFYLKHQNHRTLQKSYENIQSIYRTVPSSVVQFKNNRDYSILSANDAFYNFLAYSPQEYNKRIGSFLLPIIHPQDRDSIASLPVGLSEHEFRVLDANGQTKWVYGNFDCSNTSQTVLCAFFDISEQKKLLMNAEQEAMIDPLTGVKNRLAVEKILSALLHKENRSGALIMLDLDRFKQVNDTLGHPEGDRVLQKFAHCLIEIFGSNSFVARLGGDEFIVFSNEIALPEDAARKARQLIDIMAQRLEMEEKKCGLAVSIGIAFYPSDADSLTELIKLADQALYHAKHNGGKRYMLYSEKQKREKV